MSNQRLSKLQKWILENCFRTTVLLDRTNLKDLYNTNNSWRCKDCPKTNENIRLTIDQHAFITHQCIISGSYCSYFPFYKEDILLSYFLLTPNNDITHIYRVQHFHDSPNYTKAHVSTHRSINGLVEKRLVYAFNTFQEYSLQIHLTDTGMKKAADLLNISDYMSFFER